MTATKQALCHRCGRYLNVLSSGRFSRHNKGSLVDRPTGGKMVQVLPGVRCSGSKLTPDATRTWYNHDASVAEAARIRPGCRCEEDRTKYRNPLEKMFAQWGMHGSPTPPVIQVVQPHVEPELLWGNMTRQQYDLKLHQYAETLRTRQELLEDARDAARVAELDLHAFIHDHKPRRKP